jgi:hypothetical protein
VSFSRVTSISGCILAAKAFSIFCALFLSCSVSAAAREVTSCESPDRKFALHAVYADQQPYNGETTIIDLASHIAVLGLDSNWTIGQVKLVWSPDSRRVAYYSQKGKDCTTRVFSRGNSSFEEIVLPDFPSPKLPATGIKGADADTNTRIEPIMWNGSRELLLEKELVNPAWGRAALRFTIAFGEDNPPLIQNAEQEKESIIDYFLLLPAKDFEAPLSAWLRMMRGGHYFPCETESEHNVDEKNGYMYCQGDGAQPEFEVALFRYRDGRPLLALCSGELEGSDSVQLQFFELGADRRMKQISSPVLPGAQMKNDQGMGYVHEGWRFELPRKGRTILVRSEKTKRILHKFTWTGEKFQEEK